MLISLGFLFLFWKMNLVSSDLWWLLLTGLIDTGCLNIIFNR
jgi:hypothetical protein